jgi:glycosyltransferase involved in cell wall biosynthesis
MKIAFVSARSVPAYLGGAEELVRTNARFLAEAGHDVTILTSYINEGSKTKLCHEAWVHGVRVLRFKQFRFEQLTGISQWLRFINYKSSTKNIGYTDNVIASPCVPSLFRRTLFVLGYKWLSWLFSPGLFFHILFSKYEIIHVTPFPHTHIWFATRAANIAKIPVVLSPAFHVELQGDVAWQLCYLAGKVARLVVFTEKERIDLSKLKISSEKIDIVPPGVETEENRRGRGDRFRTRYNLEDAPIVLFAGSKSYDKGITHLIDALVIVRKTYPKAVLVAIGRGSESLHHEMLAKLPNALSLGYVSVEEKMEAFDACTVFAMPSRGDSFGIVYVDAWMCCKPVIAARAGSIPWVVHEGEDGELVAFGDVQDIANKIVALLNDPLRCAWLGTNGYQYVMANYMGHIIADRLIMCYTLCLKGT